MSQRWQIYFTKANGAGTVPRLELGGQDSPPPSVVDCTVKTRRKGIDWLEFNDPTNSLDRFTMFRVKPTLSMQFVLTCRIMHVRFLFSSSHSSRACKALRRAIKRPRNAAQSISQGACPARIPFESVNDGHEDCCESRTHPLAEILERFEGMLLNRHDGHSRLEAGLPVVRQYPSGRHANLRIDQTRRLRRPW